MRFDLLHARDSDMLHSFGKRQHVMPHSSKRSNAGSSETKLESRQLTLEDWANARRAIPRATQGPVRNSPIGDIAGTGKRDAPSSRTGTGGRETVHRPSATELLETPDALLTRTHLRELGLERRAIDAVFRALAVVALPGYSRPMIRVRDFLELLERCTFGDDRVRPIVPVAMRKSPAVATRKSPPLV